MKYLIKLDEHILSIREDMFIVDDSENKLYISEIPDYILEVEKPFYYLYPKFFKLHKDKFYLVICEHCNIDDVLKDILSEEGVDILQVKKLKENKTSLI